MRGPRIPPSPKAGGSCLASSLRFHSQCHELPKPRPRLLPLLPQDLAESSSKPLIQLIESLFHCSKPKVTDPSSRKLVDLPDHLQDVSPPPFLRNLSYPVLGALHRLRCWLQAWRAVVGHRVAQKLALPGPVHGTLGAIHLQSQFGLQEVRQRRHDPFACPPASHVDIRVVGIAAETMSSPFQFLVEFIE